MPNQTIDIYEVHKSTCRCQGCLDDAADSAGFAAPGGVTEDELAVLIDEDELPAGWAICEARDD